MHFFTLVVAVQFSLVGLCLSYVTLLAFFKKDLNVRLVRELSTINAAATLMAAIFGLRYFYTHTQTATAEILFSQHPVVALLAHSLPQLFFISVITAVFTLLLSARLPAVPFVQNGPGITPTATGTHKKILVTLLILSVCINSLLSALPIFL